MSNIKIGDQSDRLKIKWHPKQELASVRRACDDRSALTQREGIPTQYAICRRRRYANCVILYQFYTDFEFYKSQQSGVYILVHSTAFVDAFNCF